LQNAIKLQRRIQQKVCGEAFWSKLTERRKRDDVIRGVAHLNIKTMLRLGLQHLSKEDMNLAITPLLRRQPHKNQQQQARLLQKQILKPIQPFAIQQKSLFLSAVVNGARRGSGMRSTSLRKVVVCGDSQGLEKWR